MEKKLVKDIKIFLKKKKTKGEKKLVKGIKILLNICEEEHEKSINFIVNVIEILKNKTKAS